MPVSVDYHDPALNYLMYPPKPARPLHEVILMTRHSLEINALANVGRRILRGCISVRMFSPPIPESFEEKVDAVLADDRLVRVAHKIDLLEHLKLDGVATDGADIAHILCAYVGASLKTVWDEKRTHIIHSSVEDICTELLNDDEPEIVSNNSHEQMKKIPGVEAMPPLGVKAELPSSLRSPAPQNLRSPAPQTLVRDPDTTSNESVSSGRSPPPHLYQPHYHQPYQPYFPPNTAYPSNSTYPPNPTYPLNSAYPANPVNGPYPSNASNTPNLASSPVNMMQHNHVQSTSSSQFGAYVPGSAHTTGPTFGAQQGHRAYQHASYATAPQPVPAGPPSQPGMMPGWGQPVSMPQGMSMPPSQPQQTQGFISLFNELAMKHRMQITWQPHKTGQQHIPEWTMWLIVDGTPRGQGTAATKQAAKEVAAKAALQHFGWLTQ